MHKEVCLGEIEQRLQLSEQWTSTYLTVQYILELRQLSVLKKNNLCILALILTILTDLAWMLYSLTSNSFLSYFPSILQAKSDCDRRCFQIMTVIVTVMEMMLTSLHCACWDFFNLNMVEQDSPHNEFLFYFRFHSPHTNLFPGSLWIQFRTSITFYITLYILYNNL